MRQDHHKNIRRFLPLILLSVLLIAAAVFVLLLPAIQAAHPAQSKNLTAFEPTYRTIATREKQSLQSITVKHLDADSYTLLYKDNQLLLQSDTGEPEPINESFTENFIKYATQIYIDDTVTENADEVAENLPDMGLAPPQIEVEVNFTDGSHLTISLGYLLPGTPDYYYQWSGDAGIYLCNPGVYQTFEYTADMLRTIDQPAIIPALIERISILAHGSDPIVATFATVAEDATAGTLQSPFVYPMSQEATDSLLAAAKNLHLGARLDVLTAENRPAYGLANPQTVVKISQRDGVYSFTGTDGAMQSYPINANSFTLSIGKPEGEFFYYCEVDGICYRVSSFLLTAFLNANAFNYASANPADLGDETLQSITVQTGNGTLHIAAAYTENVLPNNELETDEDGNVVYTASITANGNPISLRAFAELVSSLQQMAVTGKLETPAEPSGTPRWQITLTTVQGKTRTLCAYAMDSFHDILAVDGVALHYISNEALDIALGEFSALLDQTNSPQE